MFCSYGVSLYLWCSCNSTCFIRLHITFWAPEVLGFKHLLFFKDHEAHARLMVVVWTKFRLETPRRKWDTSKCVGGWQWLDPVRLPDKAGHCGGGQKGQGCCRYRCGSSQRQQRHEEGIGEPGAIPGTERMQGVKTTVIPMVIGPLGAVTFSSWAGDPSRSQGQRSLSRRVDRVAHSDLNGLTKEGRCFVVWGGARTPSESCRGTLVAGTGSSSLLATPKNSRRPKKQSVPLKDPLGGTLCISRVHPQSSLTAVVCLY